MAGHVAEVLAEVVVAGWTPFNTYVSYVVAIRPPKHIHITQLKYQRYEVTPIYKVGMNVFSCRCVIHLPSIKESLGDLEVLLD